MMATPMPTPKYIIIWLDQYIGLLETHMRLKCSVGEQTNPKEPEPTHPPEDAINQAILLESNVEKIFTDIPSTLKVFPAPAACLPCIIQSINENKKVFFITSGSLGGQIAPDIIEQCPSLKTIYVFCGKNDAHLDWALDCLNNGVECIMENFPTDLLVRLVRDVAEYFITEGDAELNRDVSLAYSAISYFQWAALLLERANNFARRKLYPRLTYAQDRIEFAKEQISKLNDVEQ